MTKRKRGGVLLSSQDLRASDGRAFWFVPADLAREVVELQAYAPVEGLLPPAVGIALAGTEVVVVLSLPSVGIHRSSAPKGWRPGSEWPVPGADRALLCDLGPERVAVVGGTIVTTGVFEAEDGFEGVEWRDRRVHLLDVRALYARADGAIWSERAARRSEVRS